MTRHLSASTGGYPSRHLAARVRRAAAQALLALAGAGLLLWSLAPEVHAQGEPRLTTTVTDEAGVLSAAEETQVASALQDLRDRHNVQLFVAFVRTTGSATVTDFATSTARSNSLGNNDALLLVAVDDRSDALWVGPSLTAVTDSEIDAILGDAVEPRLAAGDFAGAMIDGAGALGEAVSGGFPTAAPVTAAPVTPVPTSVPGGGGTGGGSRGIDLVPVMAAVLVVGGLFLVGRTLFLRRAASRADATERDRLARQANAALLATDEAVRDADEEVGFAEAQWGEAEAAPYREALAQAREQLKAAFALRQRLDDAEPETPGQRRAMLQEIVDRTTAAGQGLKAQADRLAQLRDLERTAPDQLAALAPAVAALRARLAAASAALDRLASSYAPSAMAPVGGNLVEAGKALDSAEAEAGRGRALPDASRTEMVVALRRAQTGVASATRLIEAVERLAATLDDAAARLPGEIDAAAADIETARAAIARAASAPTLPAAPAIAGQAPSPAPATDPGAALAAAEGLLGEARRLAAVHPLDPMAALERATSANQAADAIVAGLQAVEQQRQRRLQVAASAVASAQGHVTRAVDYITTRRHGVGREARTRAAEAEARLADAQRLAAADPEGAVAAAQRATQLADEAYRLAASEFDAWNAGRGPVAGPYTRPGTANPGADVAGAIIGGIIGGMLSGGRRGAGWGGSSWGGPFGGGGGGFGVPGGPFGGGGRAGGGGFGGGGGGGGRARGGRW